MSNTRVKKVHAFNGRTHTINIYTQMNVSSLIYTYLSLIYTYLSLIYTYLSLIYTKLHIPKQQTNASLDESFIYIIIYKQMSPSSLSVVQGYMLTTEYRSKMTVLSYLSYYRKNFVKHSILLSTAETPPTSISPASGQLRKMATM